MIDYDSAKICGVNSDDDVTTSVFVHLRNLVSVVQASDGIVKFSNSETLIIFEPLFVACVSLLRSAADDLKRIGMQMERMASIPDSPLLHDANRHVMRYEWVVPVLRSP